MTRPSDITRERILKAAERLFAERGYDGTSIRTIVAKAKVNQAAINYHFDGKDGLYREVLHVAFRALTEDAIPTELIVFSDDMDGLRKIPSNLPNAESLEQDRDKPVSSVRDPYGEYESFAAHNNARITVAWCSTRDFGIG